MSAKVFIDAALRERVARGTPGLLLGAERPHVRILHVVPTPPPPEHTSAHKWAVEHARLLAAMCPGGISILGTHPALRPTQAATPPAQVEHAAAIAREISRFAPCKRPLVLCCAPKSRLCVKIVRSAGCALELASLKELVDLSHGLVSLRGSFDLAPMHLPLRSTSDKVRAENHCAQLLKHRFQNAVICISPEERHVIAHHHSQTTIASAMNWPLVETGKKKKTLSFTRQQPLDTRVYLPIHPSQPLQQLDTSANQTVSVSGRFCFHALVMQDAPLSVALDAVRHDLSTSLHARLQLLHEDDHPDSVHSTPASRALPVRVVATPVQHDACRIPFSDYMLSGERLELDVTDRFVDILSWAPSTINQYSIEMKEQLARVLPAVKKVTFEQHHARAEPSSMTRLDVAAGAPSDMLVNALIFAILVAVVAIVVKELILRFI